MSQSDLAQLDLLHFASICEEDIQLERRGIAVLRSSTICALARSDRIPRPGLNQKNALTLVVKNIILRIIILRTI